MRVLVAMSGGVDSSVAAALITEAGHDVVGVTLKQWQDPDGRLPTAGCCTVADAEDARRVAAQLDIPYYVLDYVGEFRRRVVEPWGAAYREGRTPNPCIECNRHVRFSALLERTFELDCDVLVTGHHARVAWHPAGYRLLKGNDEAKDQSYVLHMLTQGQLARVRLPVGELTKDEVRHRAVRFGLRTATKPDSQDICFVGKGDYRDFLRRQFPDTARPGRVVDQHGDVVGSHDGVAGFTVGQRRGIGFGGGERRYVTAVDAATSTITVGARSDLLVGGCRVGDVSFIAGRPPSSDRVEVKVRYRGSPIPATLRAVGDDWLVRFDQPQPGVAPGQAAVFYRGEEVLGGGVIASAVRT